MTKLPWSALTKRLTQLNEAELQQMLDDEIATHKRVTVAHRLHQRLSMVRTMRERREIMKRLGE